MEEPGINLAILLAEDDPVWGEVLSRFLRRGGHKVDLARTGEEALAWLQRASYALVITDLVMPEADGLEVLRACRQLVPAPLVVLMTGYASLDNAVQALREGAYDYLLKPCRLEEIAVTVANAARFLRLQQQHQEALQKLEELTIRLDRQQILSSLQPVNPPQADSRTPLPGGHWPEILSPLKPPDRREQFQSDLKRLRQLYQENLLTQDEYGRLKRSLLI